MSLLSVLHAGAERFSDELVPDDMIRCYSLYTSCGNDNQLPALMWLDLHMDISLGFARRYLGEAESQHSG